MFANTEPFKIAELERKAKRLRDAEETLYAELTQRFQAETTSIQETMEVAIRNAKTPQDYCVPLWTYNSVRWVRSYEEARAELGDEFETRRRTAKWMIETLGHECLIEGTHIPVHTVLRTPKFQRRLGAFFGDHFTVSLRVRATRHVTEDFIAVEQMLSLHYWTKPVSFKLQRLREVEEEPRAECYCCQGDE